MLTPVEGMGRAVTLGQPTDPAERDGLGQARMKREDGPARKRAVNMGARVRILRTRIEEAPADVLFLSLSSVTTTFTDERKKSCNSG